MPRKKSASAKAAAMEKAAASEKAVPSLFDDDDGSEVEGATLKVNEEFARRFEHNSKRAEKHRLEEKYGTDYNGGSDDESSEDESDYENYYHPNDKLDEAFLKVRNALKNKDPRLHDPNYKLFDNDEIAEHYSKLAEAHRRAKANKAITLTEYQQAKSLDGTNGQVMTYQQEQDKIKEELRAAGEVSEDGDNDGDGDNFFKETAGSKKAAAAAASAASAADDSDLLHRSWTGQVFTVEEIAKAKESEENKEAFLDKFMRTPAWMFERELEMEMEKKKGVTLYESDEEDPDGEEADLRDAYEHAYNMRFEDPKKSNEFLTTYSRTAAAQRSVRKTAKTARQRQREREKERHAAEKAQRKEERARLRQIHIEEAREKVDKIKQAAGIQGRTLTEDELMTILDDAWDNDKWEAEMQRQFGEEYYGEKDAALEEASQAEDHDSGDDEDVSEKSSKKTKKPKKPTWDDDIDITDIVPDFEEDEASKATPNDVDKDSENEDGDLEEEDDDQPAKKRRKSTKEHKQDRLDAKRQARREGARIGELVDRRMLIDEPNVRLGSFRYRETAPQSFGMSARDILLAPSDAALNEFAALKKLAPFRSAERQAKDQKTLGKKHRLRRWRREHFGEEFIDSGPTFGFERFLPEDKKGRHAHKGNKGRKDSKGKGKDTKTTQPAQATEGGADKKTKKRKRSHKHKSAAAE